VSSSNESVDQRLERIVAEFADLEPRERLEVLLEYAENLPPLPAKYQAERDAGEHRVHECQTPVFIWVEVPDGHVRILADVAPEAPTVKGFVSVLVEAFSGAAIGEALAVEPNLVQRLGLSEALGMMRTRGLHAILYYIRNKIRQASEGAAT
jgi:cysteine desulfuration protein SufE